MAFEELRALWLVVRREYVHRVKSLSFLASTVAAPMLFLALERHLRSLQCHG
jgi:ABC-type Na+ efflux pump permease subunit